MAAPTVQGTPAKGVQGTDSTTHPITLPTGIVAGEMLLCVFSCDGNTTSSTTSTGWLKLGTQGSFGTDICGSVFYKPSAAATTADNLSISTTVAEQSSHITYRISGASSTVYGDRSSNSNALPDSPGVTPTGASFDALVITTRSGDGSVVATGAPTGYSNLQTQAGGTNGASTNTAQKTETNTVFNPSNFTGATTEQWVAWTIVFVPGAAPAGSSMYWWNGSSWVAKPLYRWTGSAWQAAPMSRWDGSSWIAVP